MSRTPKVLATIAAVGLLAAAVAYVVDGGPEAPEGPAPIAGETPFEPFDGETAPEAAGARAPQDERVVDTRSRAVEPAPVPTVGGPGEGTGDPDDPDRPRGPSVGPDPERAGQPLVITHPEAPVAVEAPGEGTGNDDDPHGPNDRPAGPQENPEQVFFQAIDTAYERALTSLGDCVAGMPEDTRDSLFVEMIVGDDPERSGRGQARIAQFQSAALAGDREVCARRNLTRVELPPPWEAHSGESASYTVDSASDIEYSLIFEIEIGAE